MYNTIFNAIYQNAKMTELELFIQILAMRDLETFILLPALDRQFHTGLSVTVSNIHYFKNDYSFDFL